MTMFRWEVSEWTVCRAECNGVKTRSVECVSDEDGAKLLVGGAHTICNIYKLYTETRNYRVFAGNLQKRN